MKHETRACIAYIAGRLIKKSRPRVIFDQAQGRHRIIRGKVRRTGVYVYDFARNCYVTGDGKKGLFTLYDQGEKCHVSLKIEFEEKKFSGYDNGTKSHFSGKVEDTTVKFFDYADNRYFSFRLDK
jgi:hypothetical protein